MSLIAQDRKPWMPQLRTLRIIEIARILGVTQQRTSRIVREPGFAEPVGREGRSWFWDQGEVVV